MCDSVNAIGGVLNVDVSNRKLLMSCAAARHQYLAYLENEKKVKETEASGRKHKAMEAEVASLKKRKLAVETGIQSLTKDADDLADKAEKQHKVTLITKSNAMRRAAKDKSAELAVLSQELDSKLLELKNF